jgi:hypothetical protein
MLPKRVAILTIFAVAIVYGLFVWSIWDELRPFERMSAPLVGSILSSLILYVLFFRKE